VADPRRLRVGFTVPLPLAIACGGRELQAISTVSALQDIGLEARLLDLWDRTTPLDVIHCVGTDGSMWEVGERARALGISVVVSPVLVLSAPLLAHRLWSPVDRLIPMMTSFRMRRDLIRHAHAVVALTHAEAEALVDVFGAARPRVSIVPNGVDDAYFVAEPSSFRKEFGDEPFVLSVGVVDPRKGQLDLLRAARTAGRATVFIGGVGADREYADTFRQEIARTTGSRWIEHLEPGAPLLVSAYAAADALVLASRAEGLPLVALEAQAARCPLVLSDLPQHREVFGDRAVYVRAGDVAGIARTLQALPAREESAVGDARPWTWRQVAEALREVYVTLPGRS
jgi:glycosyltransferase involved in cell wall biosynthesis